MQKKIIALAVASALTMPAVAMAEATVYGQVRMAYEMINDGGDGSPTPTTAVGNASNKTNAVSSNASRLGFKGSEDLGGGMSFVWQMEGNVDADTGATNLFTRNTFAGLGSSFGTVVLGRHDTPYKMSTRGMDVFIDSIADNRSLVGNLAGGLNDLDTRPSDVLAYLTPNWGGFSGAIAVVGKTDNTLAPAAAGTTETSATSLSAKYGMDKWSAVFGYINVKASDRVVAGNNAKTTGTRLGGTFSQDAFGVSAIYEMISAKAGALSTETKQNNLYLAGTYNVTAAGKVKLAYTMAGETKTAGVTAVPANGATQLSVGYDHALTKNTTVFALYTSISNDLGATYGFRSTGSTGDTAPGALVAGGVGDPTALAVGIRHSF